MKTLVSFFLLFGFLAVPAAAGDYTLANRPVTVFPGPNGGIAHVSPYPAGKRAASVWASDVCWNQCTSSCSWKMETCITTGSSADACRPQLDACDRACQRNCRTRGGPWLGFLDFDW